MSSWVSFNNFLVVKALQISKMLAINTSITVYIPLSESDKGRRKTDSAMPVTFCKIMFLCLLGPMPVPHRIESTCTVKSAISMIIDIFINIFLHTLRDWIHYSCEEHEKIQNPDYYKPLTIFKSFIF